MNFIKRNEIPLVNPGTRDRSTEVELTRALRADARKNRERVFAAAKTCFAERGAESTMEEIAQRAGVGVGTLYRAFSSRSELAEAVFVDMLEQVASAARPSGDAGDPWETLTAWLRAYVDQLLAKGTMIAVLRPLFVAKPDLLNDARNRAMDVFETLLTRAQDAGAVRADLHVRDLGPLVNGVFGTGLVEPERHELLLSVILKGMRA